MANVACIHVPNGERVTAGQDTFDRNAHFFCQNPGCNARMHIVNAYNPREHFRSYRIEDHVFSYCVRNDLDFRPDQYNPKLFHIQDFENRLLGDPTESSNIHNGHHGGGVVGNNQNIPIRTLKTLYAAMVSADIHGVYGDMTINDYLCCYENYSQYQAGFTGFKIVELTYAHKVKGMGIRDIVFNYPYKDNQHRTQVLVHFNKEDDFWRVYNHYKQMIERDAHLNPIIIGAVWKPAEDDRYIATCEINNPRQHVYLR